MNNLMIDLETMGVGNSPAIIAIGAVFFDPTTDELGNSFYTTVSLESSMEAGLDVDASTILWWMQQSDEARSEFKASEVTLHDAILQFNSFILDECIHDHINLDDVLVWGNGSVADNVWIKSAYKAVGLKPSWKYWGDRCYRTAKAMFPDARSIPFAGDKHNALHDAIHQAKQLQDIHKLKPSYEYDDDIPF